MDVNSLPKTVTRQRRGCDLNPGPSAPESSTLTTRLPSYPILNYCLVNNNSTEYGRIISDLEGVLGDETSGGLGRRTDAGRVLGTHSELVVGGSFQQVVVAERALGDRFLHGPDPLRSSIFLHLRSEVQSSK